MKRRHPVSKIYKTALYLHHVKGQTEFTCSQLHAAQWDARKYYHSRLSPDWLAARVRILEEHGYPGVEHDHTLTEHLSLYPYLYQVWGCSIAATFDLDAMNAALRDLLHHSVIIDEPTYSLNIFSGNVTIQHQLGYLDRNDKCSPYVYCLPERYAMHWLFHPANGFNLED